MPHERPTNSETITRTETSHLEPANNKPIETLNTCCGSHNAHTQLLRLPTEILIAIYNLALHDSRHIDLLLSCKQISMETSSILYERPVGFASQTKLFSWIERSKEQDLRRVKDLAIRLVDVDLTPLFNATPSQHSNGPSAWDLYQRELVQLDEALLALPNLENLTIMPPDTHKSMFVRSMYTCFLARIPLRCPRLKRLTLHDDKYVLQRVPELQKLAKVVCEGAASPASSSQASAGASSSARTKREDVAIKVESSS